MAKLHDFVCFIYNSNYCGGMFWFYCSSVTTDYTIPNKIGNITKGFIRLEYKPPTQ